MAEHLVARIETLALLVRLPIGVEAEAPLETPATEAVAPLETLATEAVAGAPLAIQVIEAEDAVQVVVVLHLAVAGVVVVEAHPEAPGAEAEALPELANVVLVVKHARAAHPALAVKDFRLAHPSRKTLKVNRQ